MWWSEWRWRRFSMVSWRAGDFYVWLFGNCVWNHWFSVKGRQGKATWKVLNRNENNWMKSRFSGSSSDFGKLQAILRFFNTSMSLFTVLKFSISPRKSLKPWNFHFVVQISFLSKISRRFIFISLKLTLDADEWEIGEPREFKSSSNYSVFQKLRFS